MLRRFLVLFIMAKIILISPAFGDILLEGYHHLGDKDKAGYIPKDPVTYFENQANPIHFYLSENTAITKVILENMIGLNEDDNISVFIDGSLVGVGAAQSANITLSSPLNLNSGFHTIAFEGACYKKKKKKKKDHEKEKVSCDQCRTDNNGNDEDKGEHGGGKCNLDDFYFSAIRLKSPQTTDAFNFTQKHHIGDNKDDKNDNYRDINDLNHPYYPDDPEGLQILYNFNLSNDASSIEINLFRLRELHGENEIYLDGNLINQIPINSLPDFYDKYTYTYTNNLSAGFHTLVIKSAYLQDYNENDDISYDELIIVPAYNTTPQVHHYELWHNRYALTCNPTTVTVWACADANCSSYPDATSVVELATNSTASSWGVNPQPVDQTQDFSLSNTANETISLSVSSASPTADYCCVINSSSHCTAGDHSACSITFQKSGFLFDQVNATSCENGEGTLRAVKADPNDPTKCIPFSNISSKLTFWATYYDPPTGSRRLSVSNATTSKIVGPPASSADNLTLSFNGSSAAHFWVHYSDAGKLWLGVNGTGNYTFMHGEGYLVFKPAKFKISAKTAVTSLIGTTSLTDSQKKLKAGRNFTLSITAMCNDNTTTTPNYGNENDNNATMAIKIFKPVDTENGILHFNGGNYSEVDGWKDVQFSNGVASDPDANFTEVGIFLLQIKDEKYFGQQIPEANATIGRFYPDHFKLVSNSSSITPGCGTFTYMNQPFTVKLKLQAENFANERTYNYDDTLLTHSRTANVTLFAQDVAFPFSTRTTRLDPYKLTGQWKDGTFINSAGDSQYKGSHTFTRPSTNSTSEYGPYEVYLGVKATDPEDNITMRSSELDWNCTNTSCKYSIAQLFRYGHLDIYSNYGPETDNLTLSTATVYWDNGWQLNTDDHCTDLNTTTWFVLSGWSDNLDPGETSVTTVAGISAGEGNITLSAPGEGNWGSVVVDLNSTASFYDWLSGGLNGTATFGLYRGNDKVIHWFEIY